MEKIKRCVSSRTYDVYERARSVSQDLLDRSGTYIDRFLSHHGIARDSIVFAVVGSVGRREALEASDLDLIPIAADDETLAAYYPFDKPLRIGLQESLGVKVSEGSALTRATSIPELVRVETIGGDQDCTNALTKRVLLLTESAGTGGGLSIATVRESLLRAYANEERTSGRHALSLCNDIARYYRTLCIEYKAKVDDTRKAKDWSTRNIKLRHSRKFWYFSTMVAITFSAETYPQGDKDFATELLNIFAKPPIERLADALCETKPLLVAKLLENYALFLDFMSRTENRTALSKVEHKNRYEMALNNPFPAMKLNSDLLHAGILEVIEDIGPAHRGRLLSWFLL